jgi:hypothetical protein
MRLDPAWSFGHVSHFDEALCLVPIVPVRNRQVAGERSHSANFEAQWDRMAHLFTSVHSGHTSAINALTCFGSAARGDPL